MSWATVLSGVLLLTSVLWVFIAGCHVDSYLVFSHVSCIDQTVLFCKQHDISGGPTNNYSNIQNSTITNINLPLQDICENTTPLPLFKDTRVVCR
jgi:hypothetical protein